MYRVYKTPVKEVTVTNEWIIFKLQDGDMVRIKIEGEPRNKLSALLEHEMNTVIKVDTDTYSRFIDYCQFNGTNESETLNWLMDEAYENVQKHQAMKEKQGSEIHD